LHRLAAGYLFGDILIFEVGSHSCESVLSSHDSTVYTIAFSHDGQILASGSEDKSVMLWDMVTRTLLRTLSGHRDSIYDLAWSLEGTCLATASADSTVLIFSGCSKELLISGAGLHTSAPTPSSKRLHVGKKVFRVSWSPDDRKLLTSSTKDKVDEIQLWDLHSLTCIGTFEHKDKEGKYFFSDLSWSPDCSMFAGRSSKAAIKGIVVVWKLNEKKTFVKEIVMKNVPLPWKASGLADGVAVLSRGPKLNFMKWVDTVG